MAAQRSIKGDILRMEHASIYHLAVVVMDSLFKAGLMSLSFYILFFSFLSLFFHSSVLIAVVVFPQMNRSIDRAASGYKIFDRWKPEQCMAI